MENDSLPLIDLPDELLLIIFKKLNNVELLYSLMDCLTLTRSSLNGHIYPLDNEMLDRFCLEILPKVHEKIQWLTVESLSIENLLLAGDYPNLRKLCLASIEEERLIRLFNKENSLLKKFANQLRTLYFSVLNNFKSSGYVMTRILFRNIFRIFPNLIDVHFSELSNMDHDSLSFGYEIPMFSSSILLELHINVLSSNDLFRSLDGRLNQLRRFDVNVTYIFLPSPDVDMKKKLDHLRCFSLISKNETWFYNDTILSVLLRMINLEKLCLYLVIDQKKFIDGNCLNNDIINHLPRLNHLIFNIISRIYDYNPTDIRSNEDIQLTFQTFPNHEVISCVDFFPDKNLGQCHYYSSPYRMRNYDHITNHFPGGLFKNVREISLFDERPFEHEFFIQISQAFPFLERLTLENVQSQNKKVDNDNQDLPIIEYPYIKELNLINVHDDYIEQFLFNSKSILSNDICLWVEHDSLQRVTNHFTRDQTRINSTKIIHLLLAGQHHISKNFYQYFPRLQLINCSSIAYIKMIDSKHENTSFY